MKKLLLICLVVGIFILSKLVLSDLGILPKFGTEYSRSVMYVSIILLLLSSIISLFAEK